VSESLYHYFTHIGQPRILVLGDAILDKYVWGDSSRISPEAPIPVLKVQGEEFKPGGAGSVCINLRHLEAEVIFCGAIGKDSEAGELRSLLDTAGVELSGMISSQERVTSLKTRFLARAQQMLRVDREETGAIGGELESQLISVLAEHIPQVDLVVVSDYGKGVVTPHVASQVAELCRQHKKKCIADPPKIDDYSVYRGFTLLAPNRSEAEAASGLRIKDDASLAHAAMGLIKENDLEFMIITRDKEGISAFDKQGNHFHDQAQERAVYDVTGAGDMVTSIIGLVLADGGDIEDAVRLANVAAGIEVGKLGVAPVSRQEIKDSLVWQSSESKVKTVEELQTIMAQLRVANKKVVLTNGCFDILHPGHVDLLQRARSHGDVLVVAVNSDDSIRRLKGEQRPILAEEERTQMLSAIGSVDFVIVFEEDTPIPLLEALRPDVLVKGSQYSVDQVVGHEVVEAYGGTIALVPHVEGLSTTDIVQRVLEKSGE
jgi:D-beta-D-heptose 7-phosphate kinase/D-beta-D-heptose 1-phosphate adenosyltransferase